MSTYSISGKTRSRLFLLMLVGAVLTVIGFLTFSTEKGSHGGHGEESHGMAVMQVQEETAEQIEESLGEEGEKLEEVFDNTLAPDPHEQGGSPIDLTDEHSNEAEMYDSIEAGHGEADPAYNEHDGHAEHGVHTDHKDHDGHEEDHAEHDAHAAHAPTAKQALISNFWVLVMFAFWTGVAAIFFIAASTVAWAGWFVQIQKVLLSLTWMIPVAIVLGVVAVLLGSHDLFHWTHEYLYDINDPRYDALLMSKRDWLNMPRFTIFGIGYIAIIMALVWAWWNNFKNQDLNPSYKYFSKSRILGAISIVLIAILNAFGVWDWIMSMEPHWYSTLYAWYVMSSAATVMFTSTILIVVLLKSEGYLPNVNENHIHDLGKYTFAISVFWTYLFFSQLMLIWYGNIPEETVYFRKRWIDQPIQFYLAFLLNFIMPLLILMKRSSKRNLLVLVPVCVLLIFGHYLDFWNMMVPAVLPSGGFNLISIGLLVFFSGLMGLVVFTALSQVKDLESSQHPYLKESVKHHI